MANKAPSFDEFWAAYPLHKARKQAEQAWQRLSAGDRRAALAALPAYRQDCLRQGIAFKYAQGWLNGRRWEDEVSDPNPNPSPAQGRGVPCGQNATKREHPGEGQLFAQPLPSHPRGRLRVSESRTELVPVMPSVSRLDRRSKAGVGSNHDPDSPDAAPLSGMETW